MKLGSYATIHGREYRGIVYRIEYTPATEKYTITFSNPLIKSFTGDKRDTIGDIEKDARESIDEYLDK